ncbi:multicopper oxidase domain-containing protein [Gallibacterium salpingitidis]|uniref:Cell division protein FtsP n=1 Tax=Gallibacterium salpingitidis TaxID=505341 RepID=A0A1A7P2Y6_9PAST|nr:multicopper oxidase domain-containing protein [Gallibacterium salpingitidis]OBW96195.1 cell division protein FtsQ [Gallibacterium salpingitidis]
MGNYSRRQFIQGSVAIAACSSLPPYAIAEDKVPLWIPPLTSVGRGSPIVLNAHNVKKAFDGKQKVDAWGFNDFYLGPTIKMKQNDFLRLTYRNSLSEVIAINIQGLQANGEISGSINRNIAPQTSWSPIIPIKQNASTCWYHSDTIGRSAYQSYRGLLGMWIIDDEESKKSLVPNKYGENDIPLILQDISLNYEGQQLFNLDGNQFLGKQLFVNGQRNCFVNVPRGFIRLRLLNASVSRPYHLTLSNQQPFFKIASGLGFLTKPQEIDALLLAPGERVEVLVNLTQGQTVQLLAGKDRTLMDKIRGILGMSDDLENNLVLELRPQGLASAFSQQKPTLPDANLGLPLTPVKERNITLSTQDAMINQRRFDPRRIDIMAKLGTVERWVLSADQATGFQIQGAKFLIEQQNGKRATKEQLSWTDTVWVEGETRILVKFDNQSSNSYPFIFGASNLLLADKGCMGLLVVQ